MKEAGKLKKNKKKSVANKRTGVPVYIGKFEHIFNKKWNEHEIKALGDEMLEWFETRWTKGIKDEVNGRTPLWLNDFAIMKRVGRQRLIEFEKINPYFNQVYNLCKEIQEAVLFKLGLSTKSAMPIFALKNVAGWTDKTENIGGLTDSETEALRSLAKQVMANNI